MEIFHRGIQDFFDRRLQAMNFVDKEDIHWLKVCQNRGKVARLGDDRTGRGTKTNPKLPRDDLRQGGLAQARWPVQQDMVQRLAARLGRLDENRQVFPRCLLTGEVGQRLRPQRGLGGVIRLPGGGDFAIFAHPNALCASSFRLSRISASRGAFSPSLSNTRPTMAWASGRR